MIAPPDAQQIRPQNCIQHAGGDNQDDPAAEVLKDQAASPFHRGRVEDASRGQHDHRAFKARGEKSDALVAVVKMRNRRPGAEPQAENGKRHRNHMHHRFRSVRKDSRRPRIEVSRHLSGEHQYPHDQRQRHGKASIAILLPLIGEVVFRQIVQCRSFDRRVLDSVTSLRAVRETRIAGPRQLADLL